MLFQISIFLLPFPPALRATTCLSQFPTPQLRAGCSEPGKPWSEGIWEFSGPVGCGNTDPSPLQQPLMPRCQTRFKAGNRCRVPLTPRHVPPCTWSLLKCSWCWRWNLFGMSWKWKIALQTRGQMAKSHLERGTKFVFTAGQTADTECLHSSWAREPPNFPGAGSPHLGDFTQKIVWESSEIWEWIGISGIFMCAQVELHQVKMLGF